MQRSRHTLTAVLALVLAGALTLAACSGDSLESAQQQAAAPQQEQAAQAESAAAAAPQQQAAAQPEAQPEPQEQTAEQQAASEPAAAAEPQQQANQQTDSQTDSSGIVYDPQRDTLIEGERFGSSIQAADEVQQFRFAAQAGEWLRISVNGRGGMDPILTVLQPDRTDIAINDDRSAANRDSLLIVQVPTSGDQVIRVGAFDAASLGDFVIQVERLAVGPDTDSGFIAIGGSAGARLDFPNDVDAFEFSGLAGQTITVTVSGDTGVDVYAQLIDPDGNLIAADDDSGHGLDAEMSLTLGLDGTHRIEVWAALNLEGQRQLIGPYSVVVHEGLPIGPLDEQTAADTAGVALTFLDALRQGDSATILALAGPEALTTWGWESVADVERDLPKIQSIGLGAAVLQTDARADQLDDGRARVYIQLAPAEWLRFELISVGGLWTVDFWARQSDPPGQAASQAEPTAQLEEQSAEAAQSAQAAPSAQQEEPAE